MNQKSLDKKKTNIEIVDTDIFSIGTDGGNKPIKPINLDKTKTKELEWEKEFNDKWGGNVADYQRFFHIDDEPDNDRENIKDFIKFLLTQQRTELLEKIKGLQTYVLFNDTEKLISLEKVKSLLNKKDD